MSEPLVTEPEPNPDRNRDGYGKKGVEPSCASPDIASHRPTQVPSQQNCTEDLRAWNDVQRGASE
jgi:hypothetical protein